MAVPVRRVPASSRPGVVAPAALGAVVALALTSGTVALWSAGAPEPLTLVAAVVAGAVGARQLSARPPAPVTRRAGEAGGADAGARTVLRVVCHEFRTPVAALRAVAGALRADSGALDDESRRRALALVEAHVEHLAAMLESARRADEALCGAAAEVAAAPVALTDVVAASAAAAGVRGSGLEVRIAPAAEEVRTDAEKVRRILTNLLENARRHGPADGPVTVDVTRSGGSLHLEVGDRGPGATPALRAALAAASGPAAQPVGGGLGIWIVGRLARAMGGSVAARPRAGGGLVVQVEVPVR